MVHRLLEDLANRALNRAGQEITEGAKAFWNEIEANPNTPDPPFDEEFRKEAFRVWGKVTEGHGGRTRTKGSRSRR